MAYEPITNRLKGQAFKDHLDKLCSIHKGERRTGRGKRASALIKELEGVCSLTYRHISPDKNTELCNPPKLRLNNCTDTIEYYPEGSLIRLKQPLGKEPIGLRNWKRGKCKFMSYRSRRRIMNLFAMLKRLEVPLFVTLTYPDNYPDSRESKRHLQNFLKRLKRRWPDFGYLWKLELQQRGAPHYHIFMWGVPTENAYLTMAEAWYEIVGSKDPWHAVKGINIQEIECYHGAKSYASKYIAKIDETEVPEGLGRIWGYGGKIPLDEKEEYVITPHQGAKVLRYLRRRIKNKNKGIRSFYVDNPARWRDNHEELTGDRVPI